MGGRHFRPVSSEKADCALWADEATAHLMEEGRGAAVPVNEERF